MYQLFNMHYFVTDSNFVECMIPHDKYLSSMKTADCIFSEN